MRHRQPLHESTQVVVILRPQNTGRDSCGSGHPQNLAILAQIIINWTCPRFSPLADGRTLITDYRADDVGRITAVLGPVHSAITKSPAAPLIRFDLDGRPFVIPDFTSTSAAGTTRVRSATWHRYGDLEGELRTVQGYTNETGDRSWVMGTVNIFKADRAGRVTDSLSVLPAQTSPDAILTQPFGQKDWIRWQHTVHDARGLHGPQSRYSLLREYHLIPRLAGHAGRKDLNYNESAVSINTATRQQISISPGGTITKKTYDKFGQVITNEVGTSEKNMTLVERRFYDEFDRAVNPDRNRQQGSKGLLTKVIQHDGKDTRVAKIGYDWQDRPSKLLDSEGGEEKASGLVFGLSRSRGRPRGRSVDSRPRRREIDSTQLALP